MRATQICLLVCAAVVAASTALAATKNLFQCRTTGSFKWGCELEQMNIGSPITFEGTTYESEYSVVYDFPCTGHYVDIGFETDTNYVPLSQGVPHATASGIVGLGALSTADHDPDRTKGLTFRGDCELVIHSVDVRPSTMLSNSRKSANISCASCFHSAPLSSKPR